MTLEEAIHNADIGNVRELLIEDPSAIDNVSMEGRPIALEAAVTGNIELIRYIVEYSRASMSMRDSNNRGILHYGAESGSVEVCRYLVERVGMDILDSDANGITPMDISTGELRNYFESVIGCRFEDMYRNPIRSGFFPDPSIVRVGDDYYMVNSSFIFFPCIPISHSTDLVNWKIIGHAITNPNWSRLGDLDGGRGYWAPDISFDNGRFYITATYRLNDGGRVLRRQMVVSSDRPEGSYSEPAWIDEDGIDPSIFHEDGRHYMLLNRGARIFELSSDCTKQISEAKLLYYGSHKRAPEGPHILKKDGYYYLFEAEGGTGPLHRITVSRSTELMGIYEPCPFNPIMNQKDANAYLQRTGHGKPVSTTDGRWYMVYLCGRYLDGKTVLGRETALDEITWTKDGWPMVNGLKGPSVLNRKPFQNKLENTEIASNAADWMTPREPDAGAITIGEDKYLIAGSKYPISDVRSRNILLRRQTGFDFKSSVYMNIPNNMVDGQEAGIICYYDENSFVSCHLTKIGQRYTIVIREHIGYEEKISQSFEFSKIPEYEEIKFMVSVRGLERTFSYEYGEKLYSFETLKNVDYLSDEGISFGKRFTGALVGMFGYAGDNALNLSFRDFVYEG